MGLHQRIFKGIFSSTNIGGSNILIVFDETNPYFQNNGLVRLRSLKLMVDLDF